MGLRRALTWLHRLHANKRGSAARTPVRRHRRLRCGSLKPRLALTRGDGLSEETCRRLTLAATVLGSSMAYVTAINVAVPAIGADLDINLGGQAVGPAPDTARTSTAPTRPTI